MDQLDTRPTFYSLQSTRRHWTTWSNHYGHQLKEYLLPECIVILEHRCKPYFFKMLKLEYQKNEFRYQLTLTTLGIRPSLYLGLVEHVSSFIWWGNTSIICINFSYFVFEIIFYMCHGLCFNCISKIDDWNIPSLSFCL